MCVEMFQVSFPRSDTLQVGQFSCGHRWLGKEGKDALRKTCWDLHPNGESLIAGKSSFWQAALQCMLEPAPSASHSLPLLTHTVHARTHKLMSECTERGLIIWQGRGVRSHFQQRWGWHPSQGIIFKRQESSRISELLSVRHSVLLRQEGDWRITRLA